MDSQSQARTWGIMSIIVLIVLVGFFFIIKRGGNMGEGTPMATTTTSEASSTLVSTENHSIPNIGITGNGSYEVVKDQTPSQHKIIAPDYNAPIAYASSVTADVRTAIETQLATVKVAIAKNANDFNSWIRLGTLHKMGGDYAGAAKMWEYVSLKWPTNVVSFANLGDLYQNFTNDYPKAVTNYLQEIKNNPHGLDSYKNIFQIYTTSVYTGGAGAAENILKQGIAANPKAVDLQVILARYYRSQGRTADAKATYQAAITNAQSQGQTSLATSIQSESK